MRNISASNRSVTDVEMNPVTTVYTIDGNSSRNLNPRGERIEVQTVVQNVKNEESEIVIR
jgi:hypothetical protein